MDSERDFEIKVQGIVENVTRYYRFYILQYLSKRLYNGNNAANY